MSKQKTNDKKTYRLCHKVDNSEEIDIRVDKYIADELQLFSRSQLNKRVETIFINGKKEKPSKHVANGDRIEINYHDIELPSIEPEPIPLDIIYEDKHTVVVNKPQGMVVHPAVSNYSGTLVNALMYRFTRFSEEFENEMVRPGIVHRLDKETSGIVLTAKNPEAVQFYSNQFKDRKVSKTYIALVYPVPGDHEGTIKNYLARDKIHRKKFTFNNSGEGKYAETYYKVVKTYKTGHALVHLYPKTGRTHQLRIHMLSIKTPIVGDPVYGKAKKPFSNIRLCLHAHKLKIARYSDGKIKQFKVPVPKEFSSVLRDLSEK